jgi:hypothetical protein
MTEKRRERQDKSPLPDGTHGEHGNDGRLFRVTSRVTDDYSQHI